MIRTRSLFYCTATALVLNCRTRSDTASASPQSISSRSVPTVISLGSASIDLIATVDRFPREDEKIRTLSLTQTGGGNAGNTATAMRRLGIHPSVVTKVGDDYYGREIVKGFQQEGMDTSRIIVDPSVSTGFVYVIVDSKTSTRTCVASVVSEDLTQCNVKDLIDEDIFNGVSLLHLDSRHTEAALSFAKEATRRNVLVSLDAEKDRPPYFRELLQWSDIIFTNQKYTSIYHGDKGYPSPCGCLITGPYEAEEQGIPPRSLDDTELMQRLFRMSTFFSARRDISNRATKPLQVIVSTLGEQGSVLMRRRGERTRGQEYSPPPHNRIGGESSASTRATAPHSNQQDGSSPSLSSSSVQRELLRCAPLQVRQLEYHVAGDIYDILLCSAWPMERSEVVDTTGAGDSFIGGFLTGYIMGFTDPECLVLGTTVASENIRSIGARPGLPSAEEINAKLRQIDC